MNDSTLNAAAPSSQAANRAVKPFRLDARLDGGLDGLTRDTQRSTHEGVCPAQLAGSPTVGVAAAASRLLDGLPSPRKGRRVRIVESSRTTTPARANRFARRLVQVLLIYPLAGLVLLLGTLILVLVTAFLRAADWIDGVEREPVAPGSTSWPV